MRPRYPDIKVQLVVREISNSNSFAAIMGRVAQALRRHGIEGAEVDQFLTECRSGDYDNLLATCMKWVDCD